MFNKHIFSRTSGRGGGPASSQMPGTLCSFPPIPNSSQNALSESFWVQLVMPKIQNGPTKQMQAKANPLKTVKNIIRPKFVLLLFLLPLLLLFARSKTSFRFFGNCCWIFGMRVFCLLALFRILLISRVRRHRIKAACLQVDLAPDPRPRNPVLLHLAEMAEMAEIL